MEHFIVIASFIIIIIIICFLFKNRIR